MPFLRLQAPGRTEGRLVMNLSVPIGSTAEVHSHLALAGGEGRQLAGLAEGGFGLWPGTMAAGSQVAGAGRGAWPPARSIQVREGAVVVTVGSGEYAFTARYH